MQTLGTMVSETVKHFQATDTKLASQVTPAKS
jgi:hypothetical protein